MKGGVTVKAVLMRGTGGVEVLYLGEHPDPVMGDDELLVRIKATALNRADLLQRRGKHPPPKGVPDIMGLEMAGEVIGAGTACKGEWRAGDRVCALLPGGGYAERVSVPAGLAPGEAVLIHAGGSGVGTAAVQLVREAGAVSLVTAGSREKIDRCLALGARAGWNYKEGAFAPWVAQTTGGEGVNIVLDFVGAPYFEQNLQALAVDGRMVVIGTMGGAEVDRFSLRTLMSKRLQITGAGLRHMDTARKIRLTRQFADFALPRFADGRLVPIVDSVFDWRAGAA